jgi:hypothetical protein
MEGKGDDKATVLSIDSQDDPVEVVWREHRFTVAPPRQWFIRAQHWFERGMLTKGLELVLGDTQYEQFIFGTEPPPGIVECEQVITQIYSRFGLERGE